jgi:hypothetical protein
VGLLAGIEHAAIEVWLRARVRHRSSAAHRYGWRTRVGDGDGWDGKRSWRRRRNARIAGDEREGGE